MADEEFAALEFSEADDEAFEAQDDFESPDSQQPEETSFEDLPNEPVPIELNDAVYGDFKEAFGDEQAQLLQTKWGVNALSSATITAALIEDHPALDDVYVHFQDEDDGLTIEGLSAAAEYLVKNSGHKSMQELGERHPELSAIYCEHCDEDSGTLSPVGFQLMLEYLGKRTGYRFRFRGENR